MNLNQVTVPSRDIDQSKAFYQGIGLILIVNSPHYLRFECPQGNSTFSVSFNESIAIANNQGVTVYFEFAEGELDNKVKQLREAGYKFDSLPQDQRYLWREASLTDPAGNRLILYHAGSNRKSPPWRVDTSDS